MRLNDMMPRNKLRKLLREGKPTVGTHYSCVWANLVEIIGNSQQFDYAEFTGQYGPYTPHDLENLARACELTDMDAMIKIDQEPRTFIATRAIQSGFTAMLFADCRTTDDVKKCVQSVRLIPQGGINGIQYGRMMGYGFVRGQPVTLADYVKHIDDIVIAIMIETKTLVDDIEEALSVPGIDMVQFGPSDFSVTIGHPGEGYKNPQIMEAMERSYEVAKSKGIRIRAECGVEDIQKWIDLGCKDFCIGSDTRTISAWAQNTGKAIRDTLAKANLV
ncbi:aldolase/citrate lyase family protein [Candidatus Bathyarchaeota archaeon]|nr:aldolase/citrate lyase family protein [Candidatus Bathyarchaeota archaeon]